MESIFNISNGSYARVWFNDYLNEWQVDHFCRERIACLGHFQTHQDAVIRIYRLAEMWGNYTVEQA